VLLFKDTFQRLRPCHEPVLEGLVHIVKGKCGGMYGFVSSHAANCFYATVISGLFVRKKWFSISMICWAALISYSRIYLGVHYPGDVICGATFGALVGWGVFILYEITDVKVFAYTIKNEKRKHT
jgi:undecaprenyl-diphosphatase